MINEEKAKELADYYAGETDYKETAAYDAALAMAEWKDEQFKVEKQALIDKACKWMDEFLRNHYIMEYDVCCEPCKDWLAKDLKKAMKEK